jgi:hypothetical protein
MREIHRQGLIVRISRPSLPFLALLLLFTLGVLAEYATLPTMEGGDEYLNYSYVQYLLRENRLPDRTTFLTNPMQQQSGQPPLVYWTAAMLMRLGGLAPDDDAALWERTKAFRNPWYTPPDQWNRTDNRNLFFHGGGSQAFETPEIVRVDRVIRLVGLIFGLISVVAAYGAAKEVFRRESWALTATALFAFTPQMIHVSSFINTDIGMIAFATLATWATLRLLRRGATVWNCLLIGALLGLAALAKITGLLLAPAVGLALLLDGYRRHVSVWRIVLNGLLVGVPIALVFGPWVLYGLTSYHDPLGMNTHLQPGHFYEQPLTLAQMLPLLPEVYLGYWGKLASAIYLHPLTYTALGTLLVLSGAGYVSWAARGRYRIDLCDLPTQQALVLLTMIVFGVIGLIHWLQTIQFITGRLMFQAHLAAMLGLTGGLYLLARRFPGWTRALQLYSTGLVVTAGAVLVPVSLYTAYAPPPLLSPNQLPSLSGSPVDFDHTLRFLGYTQDSPALDAPIHTLQLCWQVLQPAARPAAFSLKFVHDGTIIGDRTSVPGMGRYDSGQWKTGDIWCDRVDVPVTGPVVAGQTYDVLLVLLDAKTQAVDWQAAAPDGTPIQYPFIAQVVGPP